MVLTQLTVYTPIRIRRYSNCAYELTRALVMYYVLVGGVISIRDTYICAVHQSVPTNRTLSSTGPLSVHRARDNIRSSDNFRSIYASLRPCSIFSTVNMSERREAPKKRAVLTTTVEKWAVENDKSLNTAVWLKFDVHVDPASRTRVMSLKCSVCSRFHEKLTGMRNYNAAFVEGSVNLRVSSVKDYAGSDMHSRALLLLKKQVRVPVLSCSMHACVSRPAIYNMLQCTSRLN